MNHAPKPDTATATFLDGTLTIRLSFPAADVAAWRSATPAAILAHLGLAVAVDVVEEPVGQADAVEGEYEDYG
jgi:hypothetical protein